MRAAPARTLSIEEARALLGCRRATALTWLRAHGLVVEGPGGPRVIEADLLDVLRAVAAPPSSADRSPPARRLPPAEQADPAMGTRSKRPAPIVFGDVRATVCEKRGEVRRGDEWHWKARVTAAGARRCIWSGFATRQAAMAHVEAAYAAWRAQQSQAPWLPEPDVALTVGDLLRQWIDHREAIGGLRERSLLALRSSARCITRRIGSMRVTALTAAAVAAYARKRRGEVGAGTVRNELAALRPALAWAVDCALVPGVVVPRFPQVPYTPLRTSRAPTVRTLRTMVAALDDVDPFVGAVLRLQATTGARLAEACALRWDDLRLEADGWWATLRGKTGERDVPLSGDAVDAVRWFDPRAGERVVGRRTHNTIRERVNRRMRELDWRRLGVPQVWSHDMRALFVQALYDGGVQPHDAAELAGHSVSTAMRHYLHARTETKRAAVQALEIGAMLNAPNVTPLRAAGGKA